MLRDPLAQIVSMMKKLLLALLLTSTTAAAQSPDLARIAASLPPLPARGGNIVVPLDGAGAFRWQSIGGATLAYEGGLRARYTVSSGKPSGAALLIPAGALENISQVRLRIRGSRNAPLVISLQDGKGVAYSFPSVAVRAGVREITLETEDLAFSMHQSRAADPGAYRVADTILISVVDISGFMSAETPDVEWTIESLEGVRP